MKKYLMNQCTEMVLMTNVERRSVCKSIKGIRRKTSILVVKNFKYKSMVDF